MNNKTDGINNYTSSIKETEIKERKKKQEKIPQKLLFRQKVQRDLSDAYI